MAFLKTIGIPVIIVSVLFTVTFHAFDHTHIHPSDVIGASTHIHADGGNHTHHTEHANDDIIPGDVLGIEYAFHYRESDETLVDVLLGILSIVASVGGFIYIQRWHTFRIAHPLVNKSTGAYMHHVVSSGTTLNIFNGITHAFQKGRIKNIQYA